MCVPPSSGTPRTLPLRPSRQGPEHTRASRKRNLQVRGGTSAERSPCLPRLQGLHQIFASVSGARSPEVHPVSKEGGRQASQNARWHWSPSLPSLISCHPQPSGFPLVNEKSVVVGESVSTGSISLPQHNLEPLRNYLKPLRSTWNPRGPPGAPQDSGLTAAPSEELPSGSLSANMFQEALEQGEPSFLPGCPALGLAAQRALDYQALSDPWRGEAPQVAGGWARGGAP